MILIFIVGILLGLIVWNHKHFGMHISGVKKKSSEKSRFNMNIKWEKVQL